MGSTQLIQPGCSPFSTTNYAGGQLFDVTKVWRYNLLNLDGVSWQSTNYSDASWPSGAGLLWVDTRSGGPAACVAPRSTQLPTDPSTTYPYMTYYFRTQFVFTNSTAGATLVFSNFIDDGAIFYLNGREIWRTNMAAGTISNANRAISYTCADACTTCPQIFSYYNDLFNYLVTGPNVLAVEVHNYVWNSADITFGSGLYYSLPPPPPGPPPFISNILVIPGETNAVVTWNTISNSTSQVEYGLTSALGTFTPLDPALTQNHTITLTGLQRLTPYFFRVISSLDGTEFTASNTFATVPYYANLMPLTNTWRFTTNRLDGVNWQAPAYDDSGWVRQGPALLHYEDNSEVRPRNTVLPVMGNGLPWLTYYFRTKLVATNSPAGFDVLFSNYVDSGAVFYLNGTEIYRLRMPAGPAVITNQTWAIGEPVSGDAIQADVFQLGGDLMTNWVAGTNCLAVEVHKYRPSGVDIVFGTSVGFVRIPVTEARLHVACSNNVACISWAGEGFTLQQSHDLLEHRLLVGRARPRPNQSLLHHQSDGHNVLSLKELAQF